MHRYEDLRFWQLSKTFAIKIYKETRIFPESEKFGLTSQIRRAAVSIPSNIAEGSSRSSSRDFARFLKIAMGSAYELETQLEIAFEIGYLPQQNYLSAKNELGSIIRMMSKFHSKLKI